MYHGDIKFYLFRHFFNCHSKHGEPQALVTKKWGEICPPSDLRAFMCKPVIA